MDDLRTLDHSEEQGEAVLLDFPQFVRVRLVHTLDVGEVLGELILELTRPPGPDKEDDARREDRDHGRQHSGVPEGKTSADAQPVHSRSSPRTKPTPRTVRRSLASKGS